MITVLEIFAALIVGTVTFVVMTIIAFATYRVLTGKPRDFMRHRAQERMRRHR